MNMEYGSRTKTLFCRSFLMNSMGDLRGPKYSSVTSSSSLDNEWMTREAIEDEMIQVVNR